MSKRTGQRDSLISPKHVSRRERERRIRRWLIAGTYAVLGIAVVLLAVGLADRYIMRPRRPVATVAGVPIRLDTYEGAYRYRYWTLQQTIAILESQKRQVAASEELAALVSQLDQQITQMRFELSSLPSVVLEELIDYELARQEAERRVIAVTEAEVQEEIERRFGFDRSAALAPEGGDDAGGTASPRPGEDAAEQMPTTGGAPVQTPPVPETPSDEADPTLTPTEVPTAVPTEEPMSEEEFQARYGEYLAALRSDTGVTEAEFRSLMRAELLRYEVEDAIADEVPTAAEHIRARHIVVSSEEEALAALERLQAGEDFAALAAEVSTDLQTIEQGGDLGWLPRGIRGDEFDEVAFALQPGEMSGVVQTASGYEIIQVTEREADHELDPLDRQYLQNEAVSEWYAQRRTSPDTIRHWDSSLTPSLNP